MTVADAYIPPRDFISKVRRRSTQWRATRPAQLKFDTPMLSICFDDFPVTAVTEGARILEAHGARGTYYASAGMADTDGPCGRNFSARDIETLLDAGHEVGCHTFDHADCARRDAFETLRSLAKNRDALSEMGAREPSRSLAYPYGETSHQLKSHLPPRFYSARGILPGINVGRVDLAQLRAFALFGAGWRAKLQETLKRAAKRKGWIIGFTHDVSDTPSAWGTQAADLDALLNSARELGFTVLPVTAALERRIA